ncbi:MAG: PHP domain-containing protein [Chloroflexi bacterium]|nr:MAG: PHP domain-containing protein [Chloroflexota bacterium]
MNLSTTGLRLTPDAVIDLQLHTTFSDGRWTLEPLLDHLLCEQFDLVAITDHDCADTVATIQKLATDKHLPVLVAIEMTTTWRGEMTDLLCFGFDPADNALIDLSHSLLHRQQENSREVYETLQQQGFVFPSDALTTILAKPSSQQPHALFGLLREHGYGLGDPSAGKLMTEAGCTFETNDPAAVVEATHQSGGVCLLAHPGRKDGFMTFDIELLDQFRQEVPIDGLEVYYPLHTSSQTEMYREYAQRHRLLISAGSDSHGPDKPPIKYQAELCRGLLERVGIQIA